MKKSSSRFLCFTIFSDYDKVADCGTNENIVTPCSFTWEEIRKGSMNFSTQIGCGGFSTVYVARLPHGLTALKIQSARFHDKELQILSQLTPHPNIVNFLGHCSNIDDSEQRVLLFEYASNGTLHEKLNHLKWKTRTKIAFQLASALEYLHSIQIIHGDIKASNILLDQHLNCKLCDFGSATISSSTKQKKQMIMGSQGYVDPDYLKKGFVSMTNDIYGYGVVLLQLITGREAFSLEKGEKLIDFMAPVLNGDMRLEEVMMMDNLIHLDEAKAMLNLAKNCIHSSPMLRPSATQILATFTHSITLF